MTLQEALQEFVATPHRTFSEQGEQAADEALEQSFAETATFAQSVADRRWMEPRPPENARFRMPADIPRFKHLQPVVVTRSGPEGTNLVGHVIAGGSRQFNATEWCHYFVGHDDQEQMPSSRIRPVEDFDEPTLVALFGSIDALRALEMDTLPDDVHASLFGFEEPARNI